MHFPFIALKIGLYDGFMVVTGDAEGKFREIKMVKSEKGNF